MTEVTQQARESGLECRRQATLLGGGGPGMTLTHPKGRAVPPGAEVLPPGAPRFLIAPRPCQFLFLDCLWLLPAAAPAFSTGPAHSRP